MTTIAGNDNIRQDDKSTKISGQQQAQTVVSLLEKYSSLHRGISEARKACSQRQLEIESIQGEIHRLVDVDRIVTEEAIQTFISEKEALLQRLETLTMTDLVEAREAEFLAKSKHESVQFREQKAKDVKDDDRNQFLNASRAFREKIRTLCLRGELFGLNSSVALLSVHQALNGPSPWKKKQMETQEGKDDDENQDLFSLDTDILWEDDTNRIRDRAGKIELENDEEIQDLLKQLQNQKETNENYDTVLKEKSEYHCSLLEAKEKREEQKKNLKSQLERLQIDTRNVEYRIEKLTIQTREAQETTNQYQNENKEQFETSNSGNLTKKSVSIQSHSQVEGTNQTKTAKDQSKRKSITPYNPYARANRPKHSTVENSQTVGMPKTKIISPVPSTTTTTTHGFNEEERDHNSRECHRSLSQASNSKNHSRNPNSSRSKRARSSRRFGQSSFRTPREFMTTPSPDKSPSFNTTIETANLSSPNNNNKNKKDDPRISRQKNLSKILLDLEDTDDDDESWLNAPTFTPSHR